MDDLALMDLEEFLSERFAGLSLNMDKLETVGDLKRELAKVSSPSSSSLPTTRGRGRYVVKVGEWNPSDEEWERALLLVNQERRDKIRRYRQVSDQRLHFCGQLMLRRIIHTHTGLPYEKIVFAYTKGNKPVLGCDVPSEAREEGLSNFNFNYSHEGSFVAAACEPRSIVGVDIAKIEIRGRDKSMVNYFDTMKKCFSASEWKDIRGGSDDREQLFRFFVFWALKESYVKATGWGLATEFDGFEFKNVFADPSALEKNHKIALVVGNSVRPNWHFRIHLVDHEHVMAVAIGPPEEAAPTFKATFKLAPNDAVWKESLPPGPDCDNVTFLSVKELMEGMPNV